MSPSSNLRKEIDQHLAAQNQEAALSGLRRFWSSESGPAAAGYVVACCEKLRPFLRPTPYRVAILRSFTLEPVAPLLRAAAFLGGIDITVQLSGFDTYAQQMLDPDSDLYAFQPNAVILAVQTRDLFPELWDTYTDLSREEQKASLNKIGTLAEWVRIFRSRSAASLIIHNFEKPATPNAGLLDAQEQGGQSALIEELNQTLRGLTADVPGVHILDYEALVSRSGRDNWHDERKWLTMRMPIAADKLSAMAQEWLRFLHPLCGRIGKVLVTDLDNTLWGGVIGEDGMDGIKLGREYPGASHHALQRVLLDLHNRGILLAIASKNNETDAVQAIEHHPEMLLRERHFAARQIHWESKVDSLRRIAEELNVGLDSLVFLDDNPVERENVRLALPEVTVIELPSDSMGYAKAVRNCPLFERVSSSEEDRKRGTLYAEQRQRKDLEQSATSVEDYYYSLNQRVELAKVTKQTLGRAAQLLKKTNQFNLTTRRHGEADIARFAADPDWDVYLARVMDRFGDNGITGVCITHRASGVCEIDTFLLSCRVIGRTVETAILHFIAEYNKKKGVSQIEGWFLPTQKNQPAESFYLSHKFTEKSRTDSGTLWAIDLRESSIDCPPWIQLSVEQDAEKSECAYA
ncbi:MAG: HAD-IIIC family phosphatase [Bryobacteraceae bacterium]|jgi:FkbH-like protein